MDERAFWYTVRQALLLFVDAIERRYNFPRTSEIRKQLRAHEKYGIIAITE